MYLDELLRLLKETNAEFHEIIVFRFCDLVGHYSDFFKTDYINDTMISILAVHNYKICESDICNKSGDKTIKLYCKEI